MFLADADRDVAPSSLERLGMTADGLADLSTQVTAHLEQVLALYAG